MAGSFTKERPQLGIGARCLPQAPNLLGQRTLSRLEEVIEEDVG